MKDKVIVITGASSGIGRATAVAFAKRQAKLVLAARRAADGAETVALVKAAGGEAIFVPTDVTQADRMEALVATAQAGDAVMVKGSYGSRMGPLVEALRKHLAAARG